MGENTGIIQKMNGKRNKLNGMDSPVVHNPLNNFKLQHNKLSYRNCGRKAKNSFNFNKSALFFNE